MPIPAPKSLDQIFNILHECFMTGRKLGDMDRYRIQAELKEALAAQPATALVYSGMLATLDNDERAMRESFRKALSYGDDVASVNFDYAISLMKFGYYDEAADIFTRCIQEGIVSQKHLDEIASSAIEISNPELSEKVLRHADKLNIHTENLRFLAMDMLLGMEDTPEAEAELLENFFPDETLKGNSVPLSEEEWKEMRSFADELKQYL